VDFDETAPSALDEQQAKNKAAIIEGGTKQVDEVAPSDKVAAVSNSVDVKTSQPTAGEAIPAETTPEKTMSKDSTTSDAGAAKNPDAAVQDSNKPAATNTNADATESAAKSDSAPTDSAAKSRLVVSPQSGLTGVADAPMVENSASSEPRKMELLIPEKQFRKERGTTALRVTYDDVDLLKVLNMEPVPVDAVNHFPGWLKELDGKTIRIRGFMFPTFEATGLTSFTLARDNGICCFVRQPKIYDIIGVVLADGVTTDYIEGRPFDVEGTFHIDPQADEKDLSRLYRIDNAKVLR
jgi:hypothetical protein